MCQILLKKSIASTRSHEVTFALIICFARLREITSSIKKQSALLEELRDIFMDKKRRPKREEPAEQYPDGTEFYV